MTIERKLAKALEKTETNQQGCLLYKGGLTRGYAVLIEAGKIKSIHRLLFERKWGALPKGTRLFEWCGNKNCLNITHWRPNTYIAALEEERAAARKARLDRVARGDMWEPDPLNPGKWRYIYV